MRSCSNSRGSTRRATLRYSTPSGAGSPSCCQSLSGLPLIRNTSSARWIRWPSLGLSRAAIPGPLLPVPHAWPASPFGSPRRRSVLEPLCRPQANPRCLWSVRGNTSSCHPPTVEFVRESGWNQLRLGHRVRSSPRNSSLPAHEYRSVGAGHDARSRHRVWQYRYPYRDTPTPNPH